jgi:hypothetical protein
MISIARSPESAVGMAFDSLADLPRAAAAAMRSGLASSRGTEARVLRSGRSGASMNE